MTHTPHNFNYIQCTKILFTIHDENFREFFFLEILIVYDNILQIPDT